jgi:hypothetical protein
MKVRSSVVRNVLGLVAAASLAACGGTVIEVSGDGGASSDGSSGGDAGTGAETGIADCTALQQAYEYQLQQATVCCPVCNTVQCEYEQKGVCCAISTTAQSIPAYTAALDAYLTACPVACPDTPCPTEPSGNCQSTDPMNPSAMGACQ